MFLFFHAFVFCLLFLPEAEEQLKLCEAQMEQMQGQFKNTVDSLNNRGEVLVQQLGHARRFIAEEVLRRAKKEREEFKRQVSEDTVRLGKWSVDTHSQTGLTGQVSGRWIDSSDGSKIDADCNLNIIFTHEYCFVNQNQFNFDFVLCKMIVSKNVRSRKNGSTGVELPG